MSTPDSPLAGASSVPASPLVALSAASVRFGQVEALRDVSLAIGHGEFIAVVGANGSGKTTLLRLLHGAIGSDGRMVAAGTVQAMVFQRPFLLRLSVFNNVRVALWLCDRRASRTARAQQAEVALRRAGLWRMRDRPARSLSGGEQQRLALARAWARRPELLFLDEPTASLDPSAKKEVEALLAGFAAEGTTLVMSTHDLAQARRLASRVVYLDVGRVHADLPADAFFSTAASGRAGPFLKGELSWSFE